MSTTDVAALKRALERIGEVIRTPPRHMNAFGYWRLIAAGREFGHALARVRLFDDLASPARVCSSWLQGRVDYHEQKWRTDITVRISPSLAQDDAIEVICYPFLFGEEVPDWISAEDDYPSHVDNPVGKYLLYLCSLAEEGEEAKAGFADGILECFLLNPDVLVKLVWEAAESLYRKAVGAVAEAPAAPSWLQQEADGFAVAFSGTPQEDLPSAACPDGGATAGVHGGRSVEVQAVEAATPPAPSLALGTPEGLVQPQPSDGPAATLEAEAEQEEEAAWWGRPDETPPPGFPSELYIDGTGVAVVASMRTVTTGHIRVLEQRHRSGGIWVKRFDRSNWRVHFRTEGECTRARQRMGGEQSEG